MFATTVRCFSWRKTMSYQVSERRIRNNRIRRNRQLRRQLIMAMITVFLIASFSIFLFSFKTKAQVSSEEILYKYYKSVVVNSGDTIWDYAQLYANEDFYDSYHNYINEVVSINGLDSDKIQAGQWIILPYYSNEFVP